MSGRALASRDLIARLVGFDTTSRRSNLAMIEFIRDWLADLGVVSHLSFDDRRRKANLYATLGPDDRPGLALSGHTDVVPIDGQDWDSDPFTLVERNGRLYGRGACDMKSFIAVTLAFAPALLQRNVHTPLHLAFSFDEEIGCIGVRRLLDQLAGMPIRPAACIVGEPTGMRVVIGHKGKTAMRCVVRGRDGHSAAPRQAVNAIEIAAEIIARLRRLAERLRVEGPFDTTYDPPYATVQTGVIRGGTALNIVPAECVFDLEMRTLPDQDVAPLLAEIATWAEETLLPEMRAVAAETGIDWQETAAYPGLSEDPDSPLVGLVKRLAQSNESTTVAFGTEAGLYRRAGLSAVVCGPGHIAQAHQPNEFIECSQVARCETFMERLIDHLCDDHGSPGTP